MSDFELIQAGRHRATCFEFEWPETAPGKAQGIALGFRMVDGDVDQGRVITAWKYFTDAALPYTLEALRALGWRGDNPADITLADLSAEVELMIQHEPYGGTNAKYAGTMQAKVAFINPLGGGMVKAEKRLEGQGLKSFGAAMRAKIKALDGGARPERKPPATPPPATHPNAPGGDWDAPPPGGDSDIPF